MKASVILLLLILLLPIGAARAEKPNDVAGGFKVNIPEGLYLYQPWINEVTFAPLFIIRDGKLLNPYALYGAKERGYRTDQTVDEKKSLERFMADNVTGRSFNVYVGTEKSGVLSEVDFRNLNYCEAKTMLSDIRGEGNYEGKGLLMGGTQDESMYVRLPEDWHWQMQFSSLKAVATPSSYVKDIKNRPFTLTEEDKTKVVESVRKELLSAAMESMSVFFRPPYHSDVKVIMEMESRLDSLQAIDLNGDGQKDFIGIYSFYVRYTEAPEKAEPWASLGAEVLFAMFDNNKAEAIGLDAWRQPAFSLGGVIDIDGDGVQEVIVQERVDDYYYDGVSYEADEPDYGREIIIFKHGQSGWKNIYSTGKICGDVK